MLDSESSRTSLAAALREMHHRGSDASGLFVSRSCVLGHTRLAIQGGHQNTQPRTSRSKKISLAFNGQLFNFASLSDRFRKQLSLESESDSELLVELYERRGREMFPLLKGMFAIAIYDGRSNELILGRDRLGKKPLFYAPSRYGLCFASELCGLKPLGIESPISLPAIASFLQIGSVPSPLAMRSSVAKVPPGSILIATGEKTSLETFGELRLTRSRTAEPAVVDRLNVSLSGAVTARTADAVEYGLLLSGGIDSALVGALAKSHTAKSLRAFSVSFPDSPDYSELEAATETAAALEIPLETVALTNSDLSTLVPKFLYSMDQPLFDSSALALFGLLEGMNNRPKVLLSGDGADDFWMGYSAFHYQSLLDSHLARIVFRHLNWLRNTRRSIRESEDTAGVLRAGQIEDPDLRFFAAFAGFTSEEIPWRSEAKCEVSIASQDLWHRVKDFVSAAGAVLPLERLQFSMIRYFLMESILQKLDLCGMAFGCEIRSPFLDDEVIDLSLHLSAKAKMGFVRSKPTVRALCRKYLPAAISRRKKTGFRSPLSTILSLSSTKELVGDLLMSGSSPLQSVLSIDKTTLCNRGHGHKKTWSLLCLAAWLDARTTKAS